jgi:hypothetical protein
MNASWKWFWNGWENTGATRPGRATRTRVNAGQENADQSAQGLIRRKAASGRGKAEPPVAQTARSKPNRLVARKAHRAVGPVRASRPTGFGANKDDRRTRTGRAPELSMYRRKAYRHRFQRNRSRLLHRESPHSRRRKFRQVSPPLPRHSAQSPAATWPAAGDLAMEANDASVMAGLWFSTQRQAGRRQAVPDSCFLSPPALSGWHTVADTQSGVQVRSPEAPPSSVERSLAHSASHR